MCHRSVGLVQHFIERAGMSTVSLSMRPEITSHFRPPRALYVRFPLGNPFGEPGKAWQHHLVMSAALSLVVEATGPDTFCEFPVRWRRWERWT